MSIQRNRMLLSTLLPSLTSQYISFQRELHSNSLSGKIPSTLGNLSSVQTLWVCCTIMENLDTQERDLLSPLILLAISRVLMYNRLNGAVPVSFGNLKNVIYLWVVWHLGKYHFLAFTGKIWCNFSSQGKVYLYVTPPHWHTIKFSRKQILLHMICNCIPTHLTTSSISIFILIFLFLKFRLVSHNKLSGSIPSSLGNLKKLTTLWAVLWKDYSSDSYVQSSISSGSWTTIIWLVAFPLPWGTSRVWDSCENLVIHSYFFYAWVYDYFGKIWI